MNKTQLVEAIAASANLKKKDAEAALNAFTTVVTDALKNGEKVQLIGFGTFETRARGERTGRNPATGAAIKIPAAKVPAFVAGKGLKDSIK